LAKKLCPVLDVAPVNSALPPSNGGGARKEAKDCSRRSKRPVLALLSYNETSMAAALVRFNQT
jgi:hypothetical protein